MNKVKLHTLWLLGMLFLMTACGDDDYYYPSVKLEFVTVKAGADGLIQSLLPDKGELLTVAKDRTGSTMIEESVEAEGDETVVTLSLFHDANGDEENYNRRAYISVPLTKYVDEENPHQTIRIKFKYHTTDKNGVVVESSKYCDPGFEYVPGVN